jgi:CHAD domain-containing protein
MSEPTSTVEDELKFAVHGLFTLPDLVTASVPAPPPIRDDDTRTTPAPDPGPALDDPALEYPALEVHPGPDGSPVVAVEAAGRLRLRATYVDTADLRLARSGVTLRHRTGEGAPTWTLKLPVSGAPARSAAAVGGRARQEVELRGGAGPVPARLAELVTGYARSAPLAPVAVLRTERERYLLRGPAGEQLAELVDDTVSVLQGRRVVARFRELELERGGLSEAATRQVTARLVAAGAVVGAFAPKVIQALGPGASAAPDVPEPGRVEGRDPAAQLVAEAIRAATRRLVASDAAVRLGAHDSVHQMRVACRRLRSDLRTFAPLVERAWAEQLRTELSWLADALGAARDLEVQRVRLRATAGLDPLAPLDPDAVARIDAVLAERELAAADRVSDALADARYVALLDLLVAAGRQPVTTALAAGPCREVLPPLVGGAWQELVDAVARVKPGSPDERWHRARIRAKRARYAAEAVTPAIGPKAARLAAAAAEVQDVLGEHQDAAVAAGLVLDIAGLAAAAEPPDTAVCLTAGRLAERERAQVRASRARLPGLWRRLTGSRGLVRWLG